jgi:hypothetical protein
MKILICGDSFAADWQIKYDNYPGLIGYLASNNMPYHSKKYGPHPGPVAHLEFSQAWVFPVIDRNLPIKNNMGMLEEYAKKMNNLW